MRFYFLVTIFLISSLGFAQKYLGNLPEKDRTCKIQNQVLASVTEAEKRGLINRIKNSDGTINHIELTNYSIGLIELSADIEDLKKSADAFAIATGMLGISVGTKTMSKCLLVGSAILIAVGVLDLVCTSEMLGGNNITLDGLVSNPVSILNVDPDIACTLMNSPEVSSRARSHTNSFISFLSQLIKLDDDCQKIKMLKEMF